MATNGDRAKAIGLLDKLLETIEARREQEDALLSELAAVLGGGEGIGAKLARLRKAFSDCWAERYRSPYQFNFAIDNAHLKRFLKAHSEAEITARMFSYLKSGEMFYVKARHPFNLFVRGFNSFVGEATAAPDLDLSADRVRGLRG